MEKKIIELVKEELDRLKRQRDYGINKKQFKKPIVITSLHALHRSNECLPLFESTTEFHDWATETEPMAKKLTVDAYTNNDISDKDTAQFSQKILTPMSHPELFHQHYTGMTNGERKAVHDFVHIGLRQNPAYPSGSARITHHLIGAHINNMQPNPFIKHHNGEEFDLHSMDNALKKSKLQHPLTTYSGIRFNPMNESDHNGMFFSPAYLSTSTRRFVGGKYTAIHEQDGFHHILEINNKIGDSGAYIGNRTKLTDFSDDEYITPRNTHFKINHYKDLLHNNRTFRIWNVDRVNQKHYKDEYDT